MNQSLEELPVKQQADLLLAQGYIVLRNIIDKALVDTIKKELLPHLQQKMMGRNGGCHIFGLLEYKFDSVTGANVFQHQF